MALCAGMPWTDENYWTPCGEIEERSGIYAIIIQSDNAYMGIRIYVGSTGKKFHHRWQCHRKTLIDGTHRNDVLKRLWNKHGCQAFSAIPLEFVADKGNLVDREQYWFDLIKNIGLFLCNAAECVNAPWRGRKLSEDHKKKMSESKKGRPHKHSPETLKKMVATRIARGNNKNSEEARRKMSISHTGKKLSVEHKLKLAVIAERSREKQKRPYPKMINTTTGEIIEAGININGLARRIGTSAGNVNMMLKGIRKKAKGWAIETDIRDGFSRQMSPESIAFRRRYGDANKRRTKLKKEEIYGSCSLFDM